MTAPLARSDSPNVGSIYKHTPVTVSIGTWQTVSGQKAIVLAQMPSGHWVGYVEACSLATAWCEDGQNTQGMTSYDLVAEEAL